MDLSNFDTSDVTDRRGILNNCSSLTSLDLNSFNTSNAISMSGMFKNCSGLKELDLSKFDTSKVTDMGSMFSGCSGLTSLDLRSFDLGKVTSKENMFTDCGATTANGGPCKGYAKDAATKPLLETGTGISADMLVFEIIAPLSELYIYSIVDGGYKLKIGRAHV